MKNFRGDVRQVINDVKSRADINGTIEYTANVIQSSDSYPFGWDIKERSFSTDLYRYSFNGKENDPEWGNQHIQDYGFRLYNPAIGKFLSVDPLAPEYPWYTPYQFAGNKPIAAIDLDGLEEEYKINVYSAIEKATQPGVSVENARDVYNKHLGIPRGTLFSDIYNGLKYSVQGAGTFGSLAISAVGSFPAYFTGGTPYQYYNFWGGSWIRQGSYQSDQTQNAVGNWAVTEGAAVVTGKVLGGSFKFATGYWKTLRSVKKDVPITLYTWGRGFGQHSAIGVGDDFFELYYDYSKRANFKNYYNINKNRRPYVTNMETWEFEWRTGSLGKGADRMDRFMVSKFTANKMKTRAEQLVSESIGGLKYGEFTKNCSRFCDEVLQAGGLSNGISTRMIGLNSPGGLSLRTRLFIQRIAKYKPK